MFSIALNINTAVKWHEESLLFDEKKNCFSKLIAITK